MTVIKKGRFDRPIKREKTEETKTHKKRDFKDAYKKKRTCPTCHPDKERFYRYYTP